MSDKGKYVQFLHDLETQEQEGLHHHENNLGTSLESQQLLELAQVLQNKDFSEASDRNAILLKINNRNNKQEAYGMKNKKRFKTPAIVLSAALFTGILSIGIAAPSFAQSMMNKVLATFNLGHIEIYQMETPTSPPPLTQTEQDQYNVMTDSSENSADILSLANFSEVADYAEFDVKLPTYLPEGYTFDRAEFYKDGDRISGKYVNLYFTNQETKGSIFMQQRLPDEETAFATGTDGKIEQLSINGVTAIMMNDRSIDWETDIAMYGLSSRDINKNELILIAESIR